jgi:hypothetical protein
MSVGDAHRTVRCASLFEYGGRWRCRGDREGEGDGDSEGDEETEISAGRWRHRVKQCPLSHEVAQTKFGAPLNFRLSLADFFSCLVRHY